MNPEKHTPKKRRKQTPEEALAEWRDRFCKRGEVVQVSASPHVFVITKLP